MKNSSSLPKPPKGLSSKARAWWKRLNLEWSLDDHGLLILEQAMRSFDRMQEASELIDKEGSVVKDRFGQDKQHPAILTERDSRATMLRALKQLGLDTQSPIGG